MTCSVCFYGACKQETVIFSKSSPPVSHTPEEDTPEADLKVAIEAYGVTVAATLAAAAAGDLPPVR